MKKLLCVFILLLSITTFALQKSGIKEYDELDLSKGEIILYMDKEGTAIDDSTAAQYYRKNFGKMGNLYLFVDFYSYNDSPESIFKSSDSKGIEKREGKYVSYYSTGSLDYIVDMKNNEFHGKKVNYEDEKISSIINFSNASIGGNAESYIDGKIYTTIEYKNDVPDGKANIYNADGSIAVTQTYKNGEFVNNKNVNYKLQKTGIPEYDNIDFSKGEIIAYYDENGELVFEGSSDTAAYRKSFGKTKDNEYLLVDYFVGSNIVQGVSKLKNIYNFKTNSGSNGINFSFYENGNIEYIENSEINKSYKILEHHDPFGKIDFIITVDKNGNIVNTEYPE